MRALGLALTALGTGALGCRGGPLEPGQLCSAPITRGCWESLGPDSQHVTAVSANPMGLFAGTFNDGVFRFESETGTWIPVGLNAARVSSLLYVPGDTARLLAGVRGSQEETPAPVFATEDGGSTWKAWDGGLAEKHKDQPFRAYSLASDPGNPRRLVMGLSAAVLRSLDGGATWEFVVGRPESNALGLHSIAFSPMRDGNLWVGGESSFFTGLVRHSSDWGDSWRFFHVNVAAITVLALDPTAPDVLWAGAPGGIMSSTDNGQTWEVRLKGLITRGILFLDSGAYVFGAELPEVRFPGHLIALRSVDRGGQWEPLPVPANVQGGRAVAVDDVGRVLVGTSGSGVWRFTPE